jgi:membrane associated rhomboid family serine protease
MIPIKDDLPIRSTPWITMGLIAVNLFVFLYEASLGAHVEQLIVSYGAIPSVLMQNSPIPPMTVFTSMFLHAGILHVGGNMLYLWIFGNNIEDVMGPGRFILFYLMCGIVAVYGHAWVEPASQVPMVGASGAVSGVLGAYLLLFPRARVLTLLPLGFFTQMVHIPALWVLGFWIVVQLVNGLSSLNQVGGVAWFAHIGGFLAGMLLIPVFKKKERLISRR